MLAGWAAGPGALHAGGVHAPHSIQQQGDAAARAVHSECGEAAVGPGLRGALL